MSHVFIAHVEKDADVALEIALGLEEAGYRTWCYELDSIPGKSYLVRTGEAVAQSQAVVVIISPNSIGSAQVTKEVVRAHESAKNFVPVLRDITHAEFQRRQPEWREAIGSATSIGIPKEGVSAILPLVIEGIRALWVQPGTKPDAARIGRIRKQLDDIQGHPPVHEATEAASAKTTKAVKKSKRKIKLLVGMAAVIIIAIIVVVFALPRGGNGGVEEQGLLPSPTASPSGTSQAGTSTATPKATEKPTPTPMTTQKPGEVSILTSFAAPTSNVQVEWYGGSVWALDSDYLYKYDTNGNLDYSVATHSDVWHYTSCGGIASDGQGNFWITYCQSYCYPCLLWKINSKAVMQSQLEKTFNAYDNPRYLACEGQHLWRVTRSNGQIEMLDASNGDVLQSFNPILTSSATGLAWDSKTRTLLVVANSRIYQVTTDGVIWTSFDLPTSLSPYGDVGWDSQTNSLWLENSVDSRIYKLYVPPSLLRSS
jgi:hypothetical protein